MATTRAQLVEALLAFPARDRAEAARELLESLDGTDDAVDVEAAWQGEIVRRVEEIETHAISLEDGPATMKRLRDRARQRLERRRSSLVKLRDYRFHPAATEELDAAGEWYDTQLPGLSLELFDAVDEAIALIVERPVAWQRDSIVSGREIRRS